MGRFAAVLLRKVIFMCVQWANKAKYMCVGGTITQYEKLYYTNTHMLASIPFGLSVPFLYAYMCGLRRVLTSSTFSYMMRLHNNASGVP